MYGMVNQAIKDLVTTRFGEDTWSQLCHQAQCPTDFVSLQYYDDKLTYTLVIEASKFLSLSPETILQEFGKHWILYTAREGYGPLMDLFGVDFKSALSNLNHLHTRMGMSMPALRPPSFTFQEISAREYLLVYRSTRQGLCPMVEGLLEGLATKYQVNATIETMADPKDPGAHFFHIRIGD